MEWFQRVPRDILNVIWNHIGVMRTLDNNRTSRCSSGANEHVGKKDYSRATYMLLCIVDLKFR